MLLLALGVPREVVMQDYLLTDQVYRPPPLAPGRLDAAVLAVLWGVQPDFLDAALHTIDTERGGLESFLTQRLGLHAAAREQLAARYLEGG